MISLAFVDVEHISERIKTRAHEAAAKFIEQLLN